MEAGVKPSTADFQSDGRIVRWVGDGVGGWMVSVVPGDMVGWFEVKVGGVGVGSGGSWVGIVGVFVLCLERVGLGGVWGRWERFWVRDKAAYYTRRIKMLISLQGECNASLETK